MPLGLFYVKEGKPVFEDRLHPYIDGDQAPLHKRRRDPAKIKALIDSMR